MKRDIDYMKKTDGYIDFIIKSDLKGKMLLKREYPGIIEHDEKDLVIAQQIYDDLKKMCDEYKNGLIEAKAFSEFCADVMYSKYAPRVVSKIVSDEIYDSLDYISELDYHKKK